MAMKPIVDELEREYQDQLKVIRVNIQVKDMRPLLARYGFEYTPTFILLDADGVERYRSVGSLETDTLRGLLRSTP